MKQTLVWIAIASGAGAAHDAQARGAFDEYGAGILAAAGGDAAGDGVRNSDIELRGAVAVVELRQRIQNPGAAPLAASLEHELPAGAQVTGLSIREGSAPAAAALPVDAHSPSIRGASPGIDGVDPRSARACPAAASTSSCNRSGAAAMSSSRRATWRPQSRGPAGSRLVLPGRAGAAGAASCRVRSARPRGQALAVRVIRVGGAETAGARAALALGAPDLIHAELAIASAQPIAWVQTQPLADGWSKRRFVMVLAGELGRCPRKSPGAWWRACGTSGR